MVVVVLTSGHVQYCPKDNDYVPDALAFNDAGMRPLQPGAYMPSLSHTRDAPAEY